MTNNKLLPFSKKMLILLAFTMLLTGLTFATVVTQLIIPDHHLKILGGKLELWLWEEGETASITYEAKDFGSIIPGKNVESPLLVLSLGNETNTDIILSFDNTLPDDVGFIYWQVEVYFHYGDHQDWKWFNWTESAITINPSVSTIAYLPGTPNRPIDPNGRIGFRPANPSLGNTGHLKYTLYTYETAPYVDCDFSIIIEGIAAP